MSDTVSLGLVVVRVAIGTVFLAHGINHVRGRIRTTRWFASIGFRAPGLQWLASSGTEIVAGALLIIGLGTAPAAAGIIGVMTVAFWTVHRRAGFFITAFMRDGVDVEGYEYVAFLAATALALSIMGPGRFALDDRITIGDTSVAVLLDGWAGAGIATLGVVAAIGLIATFWRPTST
ncbi:MAG: DoxX family protein [Acidimicrobiia bacterium]|nr:DoxX family protein [Acidimicrobiia bacterium]